MFSHIFIWLGAKGLKLLESAVVSALKGAFVARDERKRAAASAAEGPGNALVAVGTLDEALDVFTVTIQLIAEVVGFDGDEAAQAPLRDGEGGDEIALDDIARTEVLDILAVEREIRTSGFVGEHDLFRSEAVAEGVPVRNGFAVGRDGAFGFGSVGAGDFGSGALGGFGD